MPNNKNFYIFSGLLRVVRMSLAVVEKISLPTVLNNRQNSKGCFGLAYLTFSHLRSQKSGQYAQQDGDKENQPPKKERQSKTLFYAFNARLTGAGDNANVGMVVCYRGSELLKGNAQVISSVNGKINFKGIQEVAQNSFLDRQSFSGFELKYLTYVRLFNEENPSNLSLPVSELFDTTTCYIKKDFDLDFD